MPRIKPPHYSFYGQTPNSGPDWRWQRAEQNIALGRNRSLPRDGEEIYRAMGFIRATIHDFTGNAVRRFLKSDPDLVMATKLRTGDPKKDLELQCRLLAGESTGAAAVEIRLDQKDRRHLRDFLLRRTTPSACKIFHSISSLPGTTRRSGDTTRTSNALVLHSRLCGGASMAGLPGSR